MLLPSATTGTALQLRYGDAARAHAHDPAAVFAGYSAVWHLEDPLTSTTIADASGVVNGTAASLGAPNHVVGQLGRAVDFTDNADQITFTNPITGTGPHTVSLWIDQRATTNNDAMVVLGNGATNQARWFHSRFNTATIAVGFYGNDYANPGHDVQADGWALLHWVYEGSGTRASRLYRDGTLVAGPFQHATGINTQGTGGYLGNAPGPFGQNMGAAAVLDEVRIATVGRSPEWIAAEALNQMTPGLFYAVGPEIVP